MKRADGAYGVDDLLAAYGSHVGPPRYGLPAYQRWNDEVLAAFCRAVRVSFDDDDAAVDGSDVLQLAEGVVARAIVHEDELEGLARGFHDGLQPVVKLGAVLFLVVKWDNNRVFDHDL